jgi:hypothetical protein
VILLEEANDRCNGVLPFVIVACWPDTPDAALPVASFFLRKA